MKEVLTLGWLGRHWPPQVGACLEPGPRGVHLAPQQWTKEQREAGDWNRRRRWRRSLPLGGWGDTMYTMYTIYTIYTLYTIYMIYTIYRIYTIYMIYMIYTWNELRGTKWVREWVNILFLEIHLFKRLHLKTFKIRARALTMFILPFCDWSLWLTQLCRSQQH